MAIQFKGFKATKPVVRLIDKVKNFYEVFFLIYTEAGKKPYRFSKGINSLPLPQRRDKAEHGAFVLWEALNKGWNPLKQTFPTWHVSTESTLSFAQALDLGLSLKKPHLSKYSVYDYEGCVRFMKRAALACDLHDLDIKYIKRKDIRMILATAKELNAWSNNSRNKHLSILQAILSALVDHEKIEYNPAHEIKSEPVEEGLGYRPASDEDKERIAEKLMNEAPDFFEFVMFIYQSGIRRKELLLIQVKDINLQRRQIVIRSEVAKTNRSRVVPLPQDLYDILMRREIYRLPKDWYLFSLDNFKTGEQAYKNPNTATRLWRKLIIDDLGIDCKLYGMKHTGADDKIRAGMDLDVLKTLYGHRSKLMTENYAKAVREQYEDQIKNNSPAFAKIVQLRKAK